MRVCGEEESVCGEEESVCAISVSTIGSGTQVVSCDMCEGIVQLCDPATTSRGRCTMVFNVSDRDVLQKAFRLLPHHKDAWTTGALRVPCRRLSQTPFSPHASNHAYVITSTSPSDLILVLLVLREVQLKLMADTTRGRARLQHKRLVLIALPPFIHRRPRRAVRIVIRADIGA